MKSLQTLFITAAIAISLALTSAIAAEKEKKDGKQKGTPYSGTIGAVDKTAKTVTITTKEKSRTYQITSETKIQKAGKPATLDEVTVGEEAAAYGHEEGGKYIAQSLRAGPKTASDSKAKGKAKATDKEK